MRTPRLLYWLTAYYLGISGLLLAAVLLYPDIRDYLPVGGVEALLAGPTGGPFDALGIRGSSVANFGESLIWLIVALAGALVAAVPVSWTYMEVRGRREYDQSLVHTAVVLPIVVTGIVVVVQHSLALAFSLAGMAAAVRFRHALNSAGDALFILIAIGLGIAAGIGAVELAIVMSMAFNYVFLIMWINDYGARKGSKRFVRRTAAEEPGEPTGEAQAEPPVS